VYSIEHQEHKYYSPIAMFINHFVIGYIKAIKYKIRFRINLDTRFKLLGYLGTTNIHIQSQILRLIVANISSQNL
jgi:hypothetical protein